MPSKAEDREHMRKGYALLKEALDEFDLVYRKDNIMARTVRMLSAIEDTIYQYVTEERRRA